MKEEKAKRELHRRIDSRKDIFCPIGKMMCRILSMILMFMMLDMDIVQHIV